MPIIPFTDRNGCCDNTGCPSCGRTSEASRRKKFSRYDNSTDRQWRFNFKQEESTKGLYSCYIQPFIRFQICILEQCSAAFWLNNISTKMKLKLHAQVSMLRPISKSFPTARCGRRFKINHQWPINSWKQCSINVCWKPANNNLTCRLLSGD